MEEMQTKEYETMILKRCQMEEMQIKENETMILKRCQMEEMQTEWRGKEDEEEVEKMNRQVDTYKRMEELNNGE